MASRSFQQCAAPLCLGSNFATTFSRRGVESASERARTWQVSIRTKEQTHRARATMPYLCTSRTAACRCNSSGYHCGPSKLTETQLMAHGRCLHTTAASCSTFLDIRMKTARAWRLHGSSTDARPLLGCWQSPSQTVDPPRAPGYQMPQATAGLCVDLSHPALLHHALGDDTRQDAGLQVGHKSRAASLPTASNGP